MGTGDPQKEPRAQTIHNQAHISALLGLLSTKGPIAALIVKIGPITPYKEYIGPI